MSEESLHQSETGTRSVGTRWPEFAVAAMLMAIAGLVIFDSLRVGIDWADDGPKSGYFPFYIGLALLAASGFILGNTLLRWRGEDAEFANYQQLGSVFAVLIPMIVYVVAVVFVGIYVASVALIGYFMRRHGKFGWLLSAVVSIGVPVAFFLIFERWFLVPLPKGPIEQMLGF